MPEQPTIAIPLDLPDVRVLRTEATSDQELIIEVESTFTTTTCRRCGQTISAFYGYDRPVSLRHLPSFGYVVYIRIRPKRFRCPFCDDHPTTTQRLSWYEPKALHTSAYERHLLLQLINSTIADICQKEDITPDAVLGIIDRWIAIEIDWKDVPAFSLIGIDEIAIKKGHRDYVAVVTARLSNAHLRVLAVLPDRAQETLGTWLRHVPEPIRRQIRTVCTDMWEAYVAAVREVLPHATLVIDRFHVAKHYRDGADTLRKQELKRLNAELPKETSKQFKRTLWPFRKRSAALEPDEKERLDALFAHSPPLKQAYDFREQLTSIFDTARSKAAGICRIKAWRRKVEASELRCFDRFLKLLDTWLDLIANYFRQRDTSGFVEGLNNKLKVLKRRCFGIYNLQHLFQRITLDLDGYQRFSPWQGAHHEM
jgi:transposase